MRTRVLLTGTLMLAVSFAPIAEAKDERPNTEPGGLFSLFTGGGAASATPTPAGEELGGESPSGEEVAAPGEPSEEAPSAVEAPTSAGEPATVAEEVPPAVAEPATPPAGEVEVAEPPAATAEEKTSEDEKSPDAATAEPGTSPEESAGATAEPEVPSEDAPEAAIAEPEAPLGKPAEETAAPPETSPPGAPREVGKAAVEEPAWPSASDTGGGIAERPTSEPGPEATPEASVASVEPLPLEAPPLRDDEEAMRARQEKPSPSLDRGNDEIAAREIPPPAGSVAPGAVALPETEIQGEIEKPDIFFLLPKARDQSDDQVIRARIRREITQPLVKEWLEEMMLLK